MKKYLIISILTLTACWHKSELKHEQGVIVDKSFVPEFDGDGNTVTMNTSGGIGIGSTHIHKDPQFAVVFKCAHGTIFTIDNPQLYAKVEKGDRVRIDYYEWLNRDNEVIDYDFVDANKN